MNIIKWLLIFFQILDATFTHIGVLTWGTEIEANPIIKYGLVHFGSLLTFIPLKSLAIVSILLLYSLNTRSSRIALSFAFGLYAYVIFSWAYILTKNYELVLKNVF